MSRVTRDDCGYVEVQPPERRDDRDPERCRDEHSRVQVEAGAEADGDDRLTERDQDDQPVSLREVLGRDPPAASHTDHGRAEVVDRQSKEPDGDAFVPVEEAGDDEQGGAEDRGRRESEQRAAALRVVANDDRGENDVKQADDKVRDAEQHGVVSKGARHCESGAEHRGHRGKHGQPDTTLVDVHRARQPRIGGPRPPERREREHPTENPVPGRVVCEQDRDLGQGEDEGQVEEQLERRDLVLRVWRGNAISVGGHAADPSLEADARTRSAPEVASP